MEHGGTIISMVRDVKHMMAILHILTDAVFSGHLRGKKNNNGGSMQRLPRTRHSDKCI